MFAQQLTESRNGLGFCGADERSGRRNVERLQDMCAKEPGERIVASSKLDIDKGPVSINAQAEVFDFEINGPIWNGLSEAHESQPGVSELREQLCLYEL